MALHADGLRGVLGNRPQSFDWVVDVGVQRHQHAEI